MAAIIQDVVSTKEFRPAMFWWLSIIIMNLIYDEKYCPKEFRQNLFRVIVYETTLVYDVMACHNKLEAVFPDWSLLIYLDVVSLENISSWSKKLIIVWRKLARAEVLSFAFTTRRNLIGLSEMTFTNG